MSKLPAALSSPGYVSQDSSARPAARYSCATGNSTFAR